MLAGDWDYLLMLATRDVAHCREVADRLFGDQDYIKRYETRMVFEVVKQGLQLPTRAATAGHERGKRPPGAIPRTCS